MYHQDICPYCHGQNFVLARQRPDGKLVYSEIVTLEPGSLYHILCLNCGTVVRTFMDDPSVLLTFDEEEEKETARETEDALRKTEPVPDSITEPEKPDPADALDSAEAAETAQAGARAASAKEGGVHGV